MGKTSYSGILGAERYRQVQEVKAATGLPFSGIVETCVDQAHEQLVRLKARRGNILPDLEIVVKLKAKPTKRADFTSLAEASQRQQERVDRKRREAA